MNYTDEPTEEIETKAAGYHFRGTVAHSDVGDRFQGNWQAMVKRCDSLNAQEILETVSSKLIQNRRKRTRTREKQEARIEAFAPAMPPADTPVYGLEQEMNWGKPPTPRSR